MYGKHHPLSFQTEAERLHVTSFGVPDAFPIEVSRIVGSAGKAARLDEAFRPPRAGTLRARLQAIEHRLQAGETVPPITVYELGGRYFVIDGHKRVAAAKAVGVEYLDATIIPAHADPTRVSASLEGSLDRHPATRVAPWWRAWRRAS